MNKRFLIIIMVLSFQAFFAAAGPPAPAPVTLPPPVGLPIDGSIFLAFLLALMKGFYLSKKYILNKKGSL